MNDDLTDLIWLGVVALIVAAALAAVVLFDVRF